MFVKRMMIFGGTIFTVLLLMRSCPEDLLFLSFLIKRMNGEAESACKSVFLLLWISISFLVQKLWKPEASLQRAAVKHRDQAQDRDSRAACRVREPPVGHLATAVLFADDQNVRSPLRSVRSTQERERESEREINRLCRICIYTYTQYYYNNGGGKAKAVGSFMRPWYRRTDVFDVKNLKI